MNYVELSTSEGSKFNGNLFPKSTNDVSSDSINMNDFHSEISNNQAGGGVFSWLFGSSDENNMVLKAFGDNRPDVASYLLSNKECKSFDAQDRTGKTVLHYLVIFSTYNRDVARTLANILDNSDLSSAINVTDNKGNTAAHYAADLGNSVLVEALKRKGANLSIRNNDGYYVGTDTEQDTERVYTVPVVRSSDLPLVRRDMSSKDLFVPCGSVSETDNLEKKLDNIVKMFVRTPIDTATDTMNLNMSTKTDMSIKRDAGDVSTDDVDTDAFIQNVLKKFKTASTTGMPQLGGGSGKSVKGSRKINTYSEISFGGASESDHSSVSEVARMIKRQATDVHERVIKKIMDIMRVNEKVARNYKAALYKMIKDKHPELSNYDRSVEMEKLATEKELKKIDIDKVTKEIEMHISEREKTRSENSEEKPQKKKASKKVVDTTEEKPRKKRSKKADISISTESSLTFSSTSAA
jgi:hypothetical protein